MLSWIKIEPVHSVTFQTKLGFVPCRRKMYRRTGGILRAQIARNGPTRTASTHASRRFLLGRNSTTLALATAVGGVALLYTFVPGRLHNDAVVSSSSSSSSSSSKPSVSKTELDPDVLHSLVWGSNACVWFSLHRGYGSWPIFNYSSGSLTPNSTTSDSIRTPEVAAWLEGVALRDLRLESRHGACVDARGDVYQWGEGFFGDTQPHLPKRTLRGKVSSILGVYFVTAKQAFFQEHCTNSVNRRQNIRPIFVG